MHYNAQQDVASDHPVFTNVVSNIPRLSAHEIIRDNEHSGSGRKLMVSPEQKSTDLRKAFVRKFSFLGKLVLDLFLGTLSTPKASLLVTKYLCFVECDMNARCLKKSIPSVVEAYASQLVNQASCLTCAEKLMEVVCVSLEAGKGRSLRGALNRLRAPPVLPSIWTFQRHVVSNLCFLHKDKLVFNRALHMSCRCGLRCVEKEGGEHGHQ